ncbi:Pentatricopeptide repeat-containing protein [Zea mays]|nr:Pentatricopeptide repeat-containing protein [Zea mays]
MKEHFNVLCRPFFLEALEALKSSGDTNELLREVTIIFHVKALTMIQYCLIKAIVLIEVLFSTLGPMLLKHRLNAKTLIRGSA